MKYKAIVAFAIISLLLAIPLSHRSAKPLIHLSFKPVASKGIIKKVPVISTPLSTPVVKTPTPVVSTPPQIVLASFTCDSYASYFEQYSWNVNTAIAICQAESSGNPNAISPTSDFGLMQLHDIDILNPAENIAYAYYHKYLTQGWQAWTTYNDGAYAAYL